MVARQVKVLTAEKFRAETFDEIAKLTKHHGMAMFQKGDATHLTVMAKMKHLMIDPRGMREWMDWNSRR